jgi:hypothetical protein
MPGVKPTGNSTDSRRTLYYKECEKVIKAADRAEEPILQRMQHSLPGEIT